MGRQALKIVSTYVSALEQQIKAVLPVFKNSNEGDLVEKFLDPLLSSLTRNFMGHFDDIASKFEASGATLPRRKILSTMSSILISGRRL